jgi:monoamine oxidase
MFLKTQNKKIYNISIIGGGISGCISALLLSKLGHKITLFEKKEVLGGTMTDIKKIDEIFFNGPNYFDNNSQWFKYIKKSKFFKNYFYDFNYSYMFKKKQMNVFKSYIDLFDEKIVSDLFAQPVVNKKYIELKNKKIVNLLKDRLGLYQNNIRKPIEKWCKNFSSHYDTLHESCSAVLGVTRVMFAKNQDLTKKLKSSDENADKLLGLPMILPKQKFSIPKNGYNNFFYNLEKILRKKIKIKFNAKIKVIKESNGLINLYDKTELINTDKIVWAANPITLLSQLGYRNFDNPIMRAKVYVANIKFRKNYGSQNFYIQVYSKETNIFRIYIYKLKNKFKIAIETFIKNKFEQLDKVLLIKILKKFEIEIDILDTFIEKKEIRHNLITKSDYDRFLMFEKKYKNKKIIGGGWHLFGREKKIDYIMSKF